MDIHENARLTPLGRERMVKMVQGRQTPKAASEAAGVCPRTVRKWVERALVHHRLERTWALPCQGLRRRLDALCSNHTTALLRTTLPCLRHRDPAK